MKIITLNTWGGKIYDPLQEFIKNHQDIDVFCFQEIYHDAEGKEKDEDFLDSAFNLFTDIQTWLPNHVGFFKSHASDYYGLAMFVKKEISITEEGEFFIHLYKEFIPEDAYFANHARNIQYVKIESNKKPFALLNLHGLWNGQGKSDTKERLNQSKKILEFTKTLNEDFVLCGDFNLLPDTESIKMLEDSGLKNLIKEYGITSTRTSHYTKPLKFADYIFTTKGVTVKDFKVLPDEVSDHSALYLEINY